MDCKSHYVGTTYAVLTSPLYPYDYKVDVECSQTFFAADGERVVLDFESVDIEALDDGYCFDWLKVRMRLLAFPGRWQVSFLSFLNFKALS